MKNTVLQILLDSLSFKKQIIDFKSNELYLEPDFFITYCIFVESEETHLWLYSTSKILGNLTLRVKESKISVGYTFLRYFTDLLFRKVLFTKI